MKLITPDNHEVANKFWKSVLGSKPNGARTLGTAQAKYLADIFEPYYDLMVTYASEYDFPVPEGTKKIAVMTHQNYPWVAGFKSWQKVNAKLSDYDVDFFVNEPHLISLIKEGGGRAFFLPRFIDTEELPIIKADKNIDTLWFGNAWGEFQFEFDAYKNLVEEPMWITHGQLGCGDDVLIKDLKRIDTLKVLARAKKVWAIGISQLEARYYGAEVVSYRGDILPYYTEKTIRPYAKRLLKDIH